MEKYHDVDKATSKEIKGEIITHDCPACKGEGEVFDSSPAANAFLFSPCMNCRGTGKIEIE